MCVFMFSLYDVMSRWKGRICGCTPFVYVSIFIVRVTQSIVLMYVLLIVVCSFALFLLAIVLSVILRYTDSDCPFGIFKLFLYFVLLCWKVKEFLLDPLNVLLYK